MSTIHNTFLIAIGLCCLAVSADEPLPQELPPDQETAALKAAETTGLIIFRHDQAAAVATDAALLLPQFKKDARVRGWITEEQTDQILVTFIDQTPAALYRASVSRDGVIGPVVALETPAALTSYEAGAATARATAMASKFQPCSERYNTVVLPLPHSDAPENSWVVYLIPGTTNANVVPMGGMYRLEVNGTNIISMRGFTRSCIALQNDPKSVALVVSHLLDPIPTEAHVFWSTWAKKPLYIATPPNGTIWAVEGGKIRLIERKAAED